MKPYTPTLNEKYVKAGDSQRYWGFPELRCDLESKTMMLGFELFFDYNNKLPQLKEEGTNWVPTDWADYMDPDAMTTLLGDVIYNIEEEYWEACQHALKNPYETRTDDKNDEGGEAPSDDGEGSNSKSDNSGGNSSSDSGDSGDNKRNDIDSEKSSSEDYNS